MIIVMTTWENKISSFIFLLESTDLKTSTTTSQERISFVKSAMDRDLTTPTPLPPIQGSCSVEAIAGGDASYLDAVELIRTQVTNKFDASKRELMSRLESERKAEVKLNNLDLAKRYENELKVISECQLEELENVHIAIKVCPYWSASYSVLKYNNKYTVPSSEGLRF